MSALPLQPPKSEVYGAASSPVTRNPPEHAVVDGPDSDNKRRQRVQNANVDGEQSHGRARGEVSLDGDEADLERKKAQQSLAREQAKEARRAGVDVDGGCVRREPRAEVD
ncbi:hypothetical protein QBC46DRAFT_173683 [Diplogelasinospora grovesii]|uniref:Uncharacterized protein n=1 Tax=Diplogelasinospora grovesii TaxID=303347 RepID=A0AAN6S7W4_9PEZI|nr:hypothetical protein QBC46DRAFT_173683 [Diplogelasinospora grovesii]